MEIVYNTMLYDIPSEIEDLYTDIIVDTIADNISYFHGQNLKAKIEHVMLPHIRFLLMKSGIKQDDINNKLIDNIFKDAVSAAIEYEGIKL